MGYQTREHALKLYEGYFHKYMDCFNVAAGFIVKPEEESKIASVYLLTLFMNLRLIRQNYAKN